MHFLQSMNKVGYIDDSAMKAVASHIIIQNTMASKHILATETKKALCIYSQSNYFSTEI